MDNNGIDPLDNMDKEQLINMYQYATDEKFSPLFLDLEAEKGTSKFRKGFLEELNPADFGEEDD